MKWLESLLTRVTMYTLIGAITATLIAVALVLSIMGRMPFEPTALILSAVMFMSISVGASYLFSWLYGVKAHHRSALITGALLTLIFTPSVELWSLGQFALIAVIAQASKYILAPRGRHLFNPAAFAAFVAGLIGLSYASWWVATPPLFVAILVGAFLILYKTRQFAMGGVFVSVGLLLTVLSSVLSGISFAEALLVSLVSWPIIFIAGFMLSEPLTLPPRKWQKLWVAGVAAAIVALPIQLGWFHSSPEFALIVANLIAFGLAFRQRRKLPLTLTERRNLTPSTEEFVFELPYTPQYSAGQYIELTLPHIPADVRGARRTFSVTNAPGSREIKLGVKFYEPASTFKKQLKLLNPGDEISATGIAGDFVLPKDPTQKVLLIAGGVGITPFISYLPQLHQAGDDAVLLYFARTPEELAYKDELDESGVEVHYFVGQGAGKGVTRAAYLTGDILNTVSDLSSRVAYVSGPPVMVSEAKRLLKGKVKRVKTDFFSGY